MDPAEIFSHHRTSRDYIAQLEFDYIETYSFQRGGKYDEFAIELPRLMMLPNPTAEERQKINTLRKEQNIFQRENGFLFASNRQLNKSAAPIGRFSKDAPEAIALLEALNIEAMKVYHWMCWPVYRDAIVFYKASGEIISVLHICFGCDHMTLGSNKDIIADNRCYEALRGIFLEIGHPIQPR
ncbi:hypothetical protein BC343_01015 [Mucilaginibacter pedocola]|uniref:Uncharacterized protein n=2 Tax=Mucilaginibacter pedocola TaxID=1792845 RepID=A0A1S9PL65_9SPHI|nr:hypothetical protein BC343_01015 [Mucilaginibacter pedocola]